MVEDFVSEIHWSFSGIFHRKLSVQNRNWALVYRSASCVESCSWSCSFCCRTIVALVYNVLKTLMEMNGKLFDELTSSYKAERQRYWPVLPNMCWWKETELTWCGWGGSDVELPSSGRLQQAGPSLSCTGARSPPSLKGSNQAWLLGAAVRGCLVLGLLLLGVFGWEQLSWRILHSSNSSLTLLTCCWSREVGCWVS